MVQQVRQNGSARCEAFEVARGCFPDEKDKKSAQEELAGVAGLFGTDAPFGPRPGRWHDGKLGAQGHGTRQITQLN